MCLHLAGVSLSMLILPSLLELLNVPLVSLSKVLYELIHVPLLSFLYQFDIYFHPGRPSYPGILICLCLLLPAHRH